MPDSTRRSPSSRGARLRQVAALLATSAVAACFSEHTAAPQCETGDRGCVCFADGSCDAALVCEPSIDRCVVDGCDPGTQLCTCLDGQCTGALVCEDGLCTADGASSSDTHAGTGTGSASHGESATGASTGTSNDATTTLGSGPATDADASSTAGPGDCAACFDEAAMGPLCLLEWTACGTKCKAIHDCVSGDAPSNCCMTGDTTDRLQWNAVVLCAAAGCTGCDLDALTCM